MKYTISYTYSIPGTLHKQTVEAGTPAEAAAIFGKSAPRDANVMSIDPGEKQPPRYSVDAIKKMDVAQIINLIEDGEITLHALSLISHSKLLSVATTLLNSNMVLQRHIKRLTNG